MRQWRREEEGIRGGQNARRGIQLQVAVNPGRELRFCGGADFLGDNRTVFKKHQGGDAADTVFSGNGGVFIDIELGNL